MTFSHRTSWHREPNRLSELLEKRRASGNPILDLTVSNPTECGFHYPENEILSALQNKEVLQYHPNPRGLSSAREAVVQYYREKGIVINAENVFLTASTSEGYSMLFQLLCNAGDSVLAPQPSYPLFDYLAQVNDVSLRHYQLRYEYEWHIDIQSIRENISPNTKAIILVHPHNPTGMFLKKGEFATIKTIAQQHGLALIVDEVFIDFRFTDDVNTQPSLTGEKEVLTFTLNGISKSCGLPQMKLGWMVVSGEHRAVSEASERLEILCDTFLSVNTPVQIALPELMRQSQNVRQQIINRITSNYGFLKQSFVNTSCSVLAAEGGWYGILRVPETTSDEGWAIELLGKKGIYVHPGYYYDFQKGSFLVVSLLPEPSVFSSAVSALTSHFSSIF